MRRTDAEILDDALARMRKLGWQQHGMGPVEGPNCVAGAIMFEARDNETYSRLYRAVSATVLELYPRHVTAVEGAVPRFNDHPSTTFADVEQAVEKTIVRLYETV